MIKTGDRIDVVLDIVTEPDAYRVIMVGVFAPGEPRPETPPDAIRNVVQTWLGAAHNCPAFRLEITS